MIDAANTYGLYQRFYRQRPKRGQIRICFIAAAEYTTLTESPHLDTSTYWQTHQAAVTHLRGSWYVVLRPFAIAGETPGRILLLPAEY